MWWLSLVFAQDINNPGGERIPYVKLQSDVWDVVIRKTGAGRARIERVKAQCNGIWVNGCATGVDPELRQLALNNVFKDSVKLSGDFTYCSTAVLREIPVNMARDFIRGSSGPFCEVFLDPASVRGQRSGDATRGENNLVGRLMGASNTTSGALKIKAPPTVNGTSGGGEKAVTGQRRTDVQTRQQKRVAAPEPVAADKAVVSPEVPSSKPDVAQPDTQGVAGPAPGSAVPPAPVMGSTTAEPDEFDLFALEREEPPIFQPEPVPVPRPLQQMDPELAALLAPIPNTPAKDQILQPAPKPSPRPPPPPIASPKPAAGDLDRLAREDAALERIGAPEEDEKKGKKDKKKDREEEVVEKDQEFGDYILIDIESLEE